MLTGDGGGNAPALARSLHGRRAVTRALINGFGVIARMPGVALRPVELNGTPGAFVLDGQRRLIGVIVLDADLEHVTGVNAIVKPDKLTHLGALADTASLPRSPRCPASPPAGRAWRSISVGVRRPG